MYCRSISWLICMFMAPSLASINRKPDSTKGCSMTKSVREARQQAGEDLGVLLDAGAGAIVTLQAGDTRLVAHRAVLAARSPVLATMLSHYAVEVGGRLSVSGVEGPVLRHLLAYLYTLRAPRLPPSTAAQLLVAAHRFGLPALQADCERQVAAQQSVETNVEANVRELAEKNGKRLIEAAKKGAVEEVQRLLAAGANVEARDQFGKTALHWAAEKGHVEVVRRLLSAGAQVDSRNVRKETPLHYAAWNGHVEAAAALLQSGADKKATDKYGKTPLDIAKKNSKQRVIDLLTRS